ncbi:MAG: hypothetical protein ACO3O0_03465 [Bacteroidia bacterium]
MKKNAFLLLLASFTLINLSSCSKDDDDNNGGGGGTPSPTTNTTKLCNKNWKIVGLTVDGTDLLPLIPGCQLDNLFKFITDGSLVYDEGATKCDPNDPQTTSGTWSWASNETKLVIDGDTSDVVTNSGTVLKLSVDDGTSLTEITFGL